MASTSGRAKTRISLRGEQTREQILIAARRLFSESGYHRTSVYDLFERAGITKGAFFHHWKTKEDLALSVWENLNENFNEEFFSIQAENCKSREKIDRMLSRISELSMRADWPYGKIFAIWAAELPPEDKIGLALKDLKSRWLMLWKDLISKAQAEHDLRADISAENLSFLVISAICGVQLLGKGSGVNSKMALETLRRAILT